jgi:hypothetical protein
MPQTHLAFPIGEYSANKTPNKSIIEKWISEIEVFPSALYSLLEHITTEKLQWKYRPGGWSVKQVVHHCADSHMNSIIRFKLALTEDLPTIRPYQEDKWAELPDSLSNNLQDSLTLLTSLHSKWVKLLRILSEEELNREFIHPEHGQKMSLKETIGMYAWHCNHHLAHVKQAISSGGTYNE